MQMNQINSYRMAPLILSFLTKTSSAVSPGTHFISAGSRKLERVLGTFIVLVSLKRFHFFDTSYHTSSQSLLLMKRHGLGEYVEFQCARPDSIISGYNKWRD